MGTCLRVARKILIVVLVMLGTSALVYGQSGGGSTTLSGLVVDNSGGVIPGADVVAKN